MLLQNMPSLLCWVTLYRGHFHHCYKPWRGHLYCKLNTAVSKVSRVEPLSIDAFITWKQSSWQHFSLAQTFQKFWNRSKWFRNFRGRFPKFPKFPKCKPLSKIPGSKFNRTEIIRKKFSNIWAFLETFSSLVKSTRKY